MNDSTISPSSVESLALGQALSVTSDSVLPDDGVSLKQCSKCGEWRALTEFRKGRRACRTCRNAELRAWHAENKEREKAYRKAHPTEMTEERVQKARERGSAYRLNNPDKVRKNQKKYRENNKAKRAEYNAQYYLKNKEACKKARKEYKAKNRAKNTAKVMRQYHTDVQFKLRNILRARLRGAVAGNHKKGSAVDNLGCSVAEFKTYMESKFLPGMTWENHGRHGWHLDHITPLSSFDLTAPEQLKQACHYTNLQPLWAEDNLRKGDMPPEEWEQSQ